MWQSIDVLPLQCLAEYLLHSSLQRILAADEKAFMNGVTLDVPVSQTSRQIRHQSTSSMDANVEANVDLEKLGSEGKACKGVIVAAYHSIPIVGLLLGGK